MQKKNSKNKITCPVEILRKFSFGIASTYLFAILFGLFLPFNQIFAESPTKENPIIIYANSYTLKPGEKTTITVDVYDSGTMWATRKETVYFYSSPQVEGFYPKIKGSIEGVKCTTTNDTCTVSFNSSIKTGQVYKIDANFTDENGKKEAKSIKIQVCKESENIVNGFCTSDKPIDIVPENPITPPNTLPGGNNAGTSSTAKDTDVIYEPLVPLPGDDGTLQTEINTQEECAFGKYLNIIIKLIIGISAVLAMIMITMGGIEYMTSELVSEKSAGKDTIQNAILGLLIALGSYLILNTINPQLLNVCLDKLPEATITITKDEEGFARTEQSLKSVGTGYKLNGTFAKPKPSNETVTSLINNHLNKGEQIKTIVVKTSTKEAYFYVGTDWTKYAKIPINIGLNGISEAKDVTEGDFKTPKGITYITSDRRPAPTPPTENKAAFTRDNQFNMGAAFINIGAKTLDGKDRGIGFHGTYASGLGSKTQGCIRMANDDLVALAPYMKTGIKVIVE